MRNATLSVVLVSIVLMIGCKSNPKTEDEAELAKSETRTMSSETLATLETLQPGARKSVESAYGHAEFANFGMKIFVAGGGSGRGLLTGPGGAQTYMRMAEIQAGLGLGVKKFRLVWVFTTEEAYNEFKTKGWTIGGQATASAQLGEKGGGYAGAVSVGPGVYLYQITDDGLALELTVKGTKYYQDEALNQ